MCRGVAPAASRCCGYPLRSPPLRAPQSFSVLTASTREPGKALRGLNQWHLRGRGGLTSSCRMSPVEAARAPDSAPRSPTSTRCARRGSSCCTEPWWRVSGKTDMPLIYALAATAARGCRSSTAAFSSASTLRSFSIALLRCAYTHPTRTLRRRAISRMLCPASSAVITSRSALVSRGKSLTTRLRSSAASSRSSSSSSKRCPTVSFISSSGTIVFMWLAASPRS